MTFEMQSLALREWIGLFPPYIMLPQPPCVQREKTRLPILSGDGSAKAGFPTTHGAGKGVFSPSLRAVPI